VIQSLEGVEQVSVVGIPNAKATNLPAALIIKKQGFQHLTEHDVLAHVAERMPFYKQLYGGVYFVDEIPTNCNGKVLRRTVKEIALAKFMSRSTIT